MGVAENRVPVSPIRVAVLIVPEFSNLTLGAAIEPLRVTNRVAGHRVVEWQLISATKGIVFSSSGIPIQADADWVGASPFDTIFVLASERAEEYFTPQMGRFLRRVLHERKAVCAFDSAPLLLARAGLLDGRHATTHWEDLDEFEVRFPRIHVVPHRYITDGRISTTGGSLPSLDFVLELIGRNFGQPMVSAVASLLLHDRAVPGIEPQHMTALGKLQTKCVELQSVVRLMESQMMPVLSLTEICGRLGLKPQRLNRMFRRELGTTPGVFYRKLRLNVARRSLETTSYGTLDIALACGFDSRASFVRAFSREFNMPPSKFRTTGMHSRFLHDDGREVLGV